MAKAKAVVVGGGLAGLMSTIKITEKNIPVDLISLVPVKRSHSVCAQGGVNAALDTKGEHDSVDQHFYDTIYGGDFLANQPPVRGLVDNAPGLIYAMDRMGVMFTRTSEGLLDLRRFGGVKNYRTAFAGATTGQQLLYALDEQVRYKEVLGLVNKFENWEMIDLLIDNNGVCKGVVAQNLATMEIKEFVADAVVIATGGAGMIYGRSTNSIINTGSAAAILYRHGVPFANGEFVQIHPTAMPGDDKLRLMSESARGDGARIWTYKDGKPWYFLEERYPAYGNLVPRDIAAREIYDVCVNMGLGVDGKNMVYLDLSHLSTDFLNKRLKGIMDIYETFYGDDPRKVPMKIFPAVHYFMGGIHVNWEHQTCIPGLFAAGECDYMYHGANRLGANSLLSAMHSGTVAGPAVVKYINGLNATAEETIGNLGEQIVKKQQAEHEKLMKMDGKENPYKLHDEMSDIMYRNATIVRINKDLEETDVKLQEFQQRWKNINVTDNGPYSNQTVMYVRQLRGMMDLARVIVGGALRRNESRGSHYKPEFPKRDDENFLKTTLATYKNGNPTFGWEEVDISMLKPVERKY